MSQESREIRVFISSTFADMGAERAYLNKKIFPRLRKICQQRNVVFTEVDLQWGITEQQAKDGKAIEMCLDEINRCHPYFIGLLGERYGWAPKDDCWTDVPVRDAALKENVNKWSESGQSVTAMEIMHGVLENAAEAPFAYFYFRKQSLTDELAAGSDNTAAFYDVDVSKQDRLTALKEQIESNRGKWHIRSGDNAYGKVSELGQQVYDDLKSIIDGKYPENEEISDLQRERNMHAAFAQSRRSKHKQGEPSSYIADKNVLSDISQHFSSSRTPCVVTGDMGSGKSALLVHVADGWKQKHSNGFVIEHYAGSGGKSDDVSVLRRIISEIKERFSLEEDVPKSDDDVYHDFASWLLRVPQDTPFLLLVDGVNQFTNNQGCLKRFVNAFPAKLDKYKHIILSTLEGEVMDVAHNRDWPIKYVQPLTSKQKEQLVEAYLLHYSKDLSGLTGKLVQKKSTENPLYLRIVLDELRVGAVHGNLEGKLNGYLQAETPVELFSLVLKRWEEDYGEKGDEGSFVREVLGLIACSRYGLSESELRSILWPDLYKDDEVDCFTDKNVRELSMLIYGAGDYLADRNGLYGFMHDALRLAIEAKDSNWFDDEFKQGCRQRIVDYFAIQEVSQRQIDELPWHYKQLGDKEKLKRYLKNTRVFWVRADMRRDTWKNEISSYWIFANCTVDEMFPCYMEQVQREPLMAPDSWSLARVLAVYFNNISSHKEAKVLGEYAYEKLIKCDESLINKYDPYRETLLEVTSSLAAYYRKVKEPEIAAALLEEALSKQIAGVNLTIVLGAKLNLANIYDDMGEVNKALGLLESLIKEKQSPKSLSNAYMTLSSVLSKCGRVQEAIECCENAVEIQRKLSGSQSHDLGMALSNLGTICAQNKLELAERYFREALTHLSSLPQAHDNHIQVRQNLAVILTRKMKVIVDLPEKEIALREILSLLSGFPRENIVRYKGELANTLLVQGKVTIEVLEILVELISYSGDEPNVSAFFKVLKSFLTKTDSPECKDICYEAFYEMIKYHDVGSIFLRFYEVASELNKLEGVNSGNIIFDFVKDIALNEKQIKDILEVDKLLAMVESEMKFF